MIRQRCIPTITAVVLAAALAACSGGTGTSASPGVSPAGSAQPPASATAAPTASEMPTTAPTMPSVSPETSKWKAFQQQAVAYTPSGKKYGGLVEKWTAGDIAGAKAIATEMLTASNDLIAWLDANPPDACYRPSWEPLRAAAVEIAAGAQAYLDDDAATGRDRMFEGGILLVDAGGTIQDSGNRCRAAG